MAYPEIGSKYEGPVLDKPCLRQLPSGWILETDDELKATLPERIGHALALLLGAWIVVCLIFALGGPKV